VQVEDQPERIDDVELAQQRPQQQRPPQQLPQRQQPRRTPPPPPRPPEKTGEQITSESESRREATLNQIVRLPRWDHMIRRLPVPTPPGTRWTQAPLPEDWRPTIQKINPAYVKFTEDAARKYGIPPELLARLLYRESGYNPVANANEPLKAQGISQMFDGARTETMKKMRIATHTFAGNAKVQIEVGAYYLAEQYKRFADWPKAVAAYHFGAERVEAYLAGRGRDYESVASRLATYRSNETTADKIAEDMSKAPGRAKAQIDQWFELENYLPYVFLGDPKRYE
jgi:soluble lytic murein transglycosylase-like protein